MFKQLCVTSLLLGLCLEARAEFKPSSQGTQNNNYLRSQTTVKPSTAKPSAKTTTTTSSTTAKTSSRPVDNSKPKETAADSWALLLKQVDEWNKKQETPDDKLLEKLSAIKPDFYDFSALVTLVDEERGSIEGVTKFLNRIMDVEEHFSADLEKVLKESKMGDEAKEVIKMVYQERAKEMTQKMAELSKQILADRKYPIDPRILAIARMAKEFGKKMKGGYEESIATLEDPNSHFPPAPCPACSMGDLVPNLLKTENFGRGKDRVFEDIAIIDKKIYALRTKNMITEIRDDKGNYTRIAGSSDPLHKKIDALIKEGKDGWVQKLPETGEVFTIRGPIETVTLEVCEYCIGHSKVYKDRLEQKKKDLSKALGVPVEKFVIVDNNKQLGKWQVKVDGEPLYEDYTPLTENLPSMANLAPEPGTIKLEVPAIEIQPLITKPKKK